MEINWEQIDVLLQATIEKLIDTKDAATEVITIVEQNEFCININATSEIAEIMVYQSADNEVIAWLQYFQARKQWGFNVRREYLEKHVKNLIILSQMEVL